MRNYICSHCGAHLDPCERCDCRNEPNQPEPKAHESMTPYERTKAAVYATGNRWAIENFHDTHDRRG